MLVGRDWEKNLKVCPRCSFHFKLSAYERIELLTDADSFVELDSDIVSVDPLKFVVRSEVYTSKLREESENVGLNEAVVIGHATIEELPLALAVMDFNFIGGSMGSAVGEKITLAIELGIKKKHTSADLFNLWRCPHARGTLLADADGKNCGGTVKTGGGKTPLF